MAVSGNMKQSSILIILSLTTISLFGQNDSAYWALISKKIRGMEPNGIIYYSNRLPKNIVNNSINELRKSTFEDAKALTGIKDYSLTNSEVRYIRRRMKEAVFEILPNSLIPMSIAVESDSIVNQINSLNSIIRDSVLGLIPGQRPKTPVLKWAYYFSNPVYLRNNSMLFYFFMYIRNSSGGHSFGIRRLVNGQWENELYLLGGDW